LCDSRVADSKPEPVYSGGMAEPPSQDVTQLLVEAAWLTARLAVGLGVTAVVGALALTRFLRPGGSPRIKASGSLWRVVVTAAALGIGIGLVSVTRGEAERWLPPILEGIVAGVSAIGALAAGTFGAWTVVALGRNLALGALVRQGGSLVTTGPFGVVRHPFYLAMGVLLAAGGLAMGSLSGTAAAIVLYAGATAWRARLEETLLARAYPEAFAAYAARVRAFRPRL
jgi:protein-S-isoprenylcysteine O-methyltransferase Ste14